MVECEIRDPALAEAGKRRIEWAFQSMPVLQSIRKQFIKAQPLADLCVAACLPVTTETANLMVTLRDAGARRLTLFGSNPLSIQDDVAASLVKDYGISTFAQRGEPVQFGKLVESEPDIVVDSGNQLGAALHAAERTGAAIIGGTEESVQTVLQLRAQAAAGTLAYPVVAVHEATTRHFFDNRYGTGQSTIDGVLRATNILLAGMNLVVGGYGWCGRGVASRARGLGANVIVTEVDPLKALEALMDGYRVMSMSEAASLGDVFITVTGNKSVIAREHFEKMKSGAILCNSGHFNVEIDLDTLAKLASSRRLMRESVEEYALRDGRRLYVLGEGRLINLASGEGNPASVMDMSFANQALCIQYLVANRGKLDRSVFPVPEAIDREVARMKLDLMGVKIDRLTPEQERYIGGRSTAAGV
jgi:adenosylhomocysteinase